MTASGLPADVLDHIARQLGFRGWAALKYFWLLERAVFVPDDAPTINAALKAATRPQGRGPRRRRAGAAGAVR